MAHVGWPDGLVEREHELGVIDAAVAGVEGLDAGQPAPGRGRENPVAAKR
jgi:hypothetical protein